jgi:putative oxidoreductase
MVLTSLSRYRDLGLLVLRLGVGIMFLTHGFPKLIGGPEKWEKIGGAMKYTGIEFAPAFWGFMAAFSEFFGAICLIMGIFFRPACMLLTITMAVAATMHLGKGEGLQRASHAIESGILFLSLIFIGPGKHSIDKN